MDQPGMVANSARGQFNRENEYSMSPFAPENLVARKRVPPFRPASACSFSMLRLDLVLTYEIPPDFRGGVHLFIYRHTPSGQYRGYQVMQLRTGGVHCRESASTGPVVLKVVPVTGAALTSPWTNNMRLHFPTPTNGMKWAC